MTTERIREAFEACRKLLPNTIPVRNGLPDQHAAYMCEEGATYAEHRREKAMRWLGFVQGYLWGKKGVPIETLKDMNRPRE